MSTETEGAKHKEARDIALLVSWCPSTHDTRLPDEEVAQAAFFRVLKRGNAELAGNLHDLNKSQKHYSVWPTKWGRVEAGLLSPQVIHAFLHGIHGIDEDLDVISHIVLSDLLQSAVDNYERLEMRFLRPTGFSLGNGMFHAIPGVHLVFGGLKRLWESMGGPALPHLDYDVVCCPYISGRSQRVNYVKRGYWRSGFVGKIEYRVDALPADQRQALYALARLGEVAGVGYHTGRGMGKVKVKVR